jgi:hypothetical protein
MTGSLLTCLINMRCEARGGLMSYTSPCETVAAVSSRSNSEVLAVCVLLAHPRAVFHPCTYVLRRYTATVGAALIRYDDVKVAATYAFLGL